MVKPEHQEAAERGRTREEALEALASGDVLGLGRRSELGVPPE